jgi:NAD(P)-dependent dehydrogenase (short-subunit alcohol dehydrogenase family)
MDDPVDPDDIAALAVFPASDGKSISGQALPIDGDKHFT